MYWSIHHVTFTNRRTYAQYIPSKATYTEGEIAFSKSNILDLAVLTFFYVFYKSET